MGKKPILKRFAKERKSRALNEITFFKIDFCFRISSFVLSFSGERSHIETFADTVEADSRFK